MNLHPLNYVDMGKIMHNVNIINPKAGKGLAEKFISENEEVCTTKCVGDAERIAFDICNEKENVHLTVYGGDGTINEAVNGILKSKHADSAILSAYPAGTGNDFLRVAKNKIVNCDVVKYSDRYFINMLNIGFDCDVVIKTSKMKKKPLISGSMAYILSVAARFFQKFGQNMCVKVTDADGVEHNYEGEYLLCLVGNGSYYGGGFHSSPDSDVTDGIMELIMVKKMSRLKFISLIGVYKKGLHIKDGKIIEKFRDYFTYVKCKHVEISQINYYCVDGEIEYVKDKNKPICLDVVPGALKFKF